MAPRKTPNPRKSTTKPKSQLGKPAASKSKTPTAKQAITKQYGLVENAEGKLVKPNMAFLERQLAAQGWGKGQTGVTPVMIGGMRFLTGMGKLTYTGERSDAAKRNPGAPWAGNAGAGGGPMAGGVATGEIDREKAWTTGVSGSTGEFITEQGQSSLAAGEAETATTTKKKKRPARKLVKKATKKKSPGGKKITMGERKKIRSVKNPAAVKKASDRMRRRKKK